MVGVRMWVAALVAVACVVSGCARSSSSQPAAPPAAAVLEPLERFAAARAEFVASLEGLRVGDDAQFVAALEVLGAALTATAADLDEDDVSPVSERATFAEVAADASGVWAAVSPEGSVSVAEAVAALVAVDAAAADLAAAAVTRGGGQPVVPSVPLEVLGSVSDASDVVDGPVLDVCGSPVAAPVVAGRRVQTDGLQLLARVLVFADDAEAEAFVDAQVAAAVDGACRDAGRVFGEPVSGGEVAAVPFTYVDGSRAVAEFRLAGPVVLVAVAVADGVVAGDGGAVAAAEALRLADAMVVAAVRG